MRGPLRPAAAKAPARLAAALPPPRSALRWTGRAKPASAGHHHSDRARGSCTRTQPGGSGRSCRSETARTRRPGSHTGGSPETPAPQMAADHRHRVSGLPGPGRSPSDPARSGGGRFRQDCGVHSLWTGCWPYGPQSARRTARIPRRHSAQTNLLSDRMSTFLRRVRRTTLAECAITRPCCCIATLRPNRMGTELGD
jgi:hypothetical protein